MLKKLGVWTVVAVAVVLAVQVLTRVGPPPSLVAPPEFELSGLDPRVERAPPRPPEPDAAEPRESVATGGGAQELAANESTTPRPAADGSRRFTFDCGNGVIFAVRTVPGEATLFSPQALGAQIITLPQVDAASGARYAEGPVSYWNKGGLATFDIRERTFADCTSSPGAAQTAEARRRSVTFRARGNEPSWLLEISRERIELTLELGTRRIDFPYREPTVNGARTTYQAFSGMQEFNAVIDRVACNDTMSGEPFASTVTVTFENRTFYGCGESP